jgi:hypothetical protein
LNVPARFPFACNDSSLIFNGELRVNDKIITQQDAIASIQCRR